MEKFDLFSFLFVGSYVIKLSSVIKKNWWKFAQKNNRKVCAIIISRQQVDEEKREKSL